MSLARLGFRLRVADPRSRCSAAVESHGQVMAKEATITSNIRIPASVLNAKAQGTILPPTRRHHCYLNCYLNCYLSIAISAEDNRRVFFVMLL